MNVVSPGRLEAGMEGLRREMEKLEMGRDPVGTLSPRSPAR